MVLVPSTSFVATKGERVKVWKCEKGKWMINCKTTRQDGDVCGVCNGQGSCVQMAAGTIPTSVNSCGREDRGGERRCEWFGEEKREAGWVEREEEPGGPTVFKPEIEGERAPFHHPHQIP